MINISDFTSPHHPFVDERYRCRPIPGYAVQGKDAGTKNSSSDTTVPLLLC
ncbi:MAG: hypothetical protein RR279_00590 [Alistipes sp.]